jgi:hypothetical protein
LRPKHVYIFVWLALFSGCGQVPVSVDTDQYEPRIVVDGYLFPHQPVKEIRITRNFPLNRKIDLNSIILYNAQVTLFDLPAEKGYPLIFNPGALSFECADTSLCIEYGKSYQVQVQAMVDAKTIDARCTTRIPEKGFQIVDARCVLPPLKYRQRNEDNQLQEFKIVFQRSPDTDSYISSITALDANKETFIEENSYDIKKQDLEENNLQTYLKYRNQWIRTRNDEGLSTIEIEWFNIWYYGRYQVILYAADQNFTDYFLSYKQVQDIDGNLWQPRFHFEGEGIGVFGAAIADTVYFEVLR